MMAREHILFLTAPSEAIATAAVAEFGASGTILGHAVGVDTIVRQDGARLLLRGSGFADLYTDAVSSQGWTTRGCAEFRDGVPQHRQLLDHIRAFATGIRYLVLQAPSVAAVQTQRTNIAGGSLFGFPLTGGRSAGLRIPQNGEPHLVVLGPSAEMATIEAQPDAGGWVQLEAGHWDDDDLPETPLLAYAWGWLVGSGGA